MSQPRFICRKELAALLEVSVDSIRRNEVRLGLVKTKVTLNRRLIRYWRLATFAELRARRLLE